MLLVRPLGYDNLMQSYPCSLTRWANTPPRGPWANVTRSTGINLQWPLEIACQGDLSFGVDCIETDRLGLAGYALLEVRHLTLLLCVCAERGKRTPRNATPLDSTCCTPTPPPSAPRRSQCL